MSETTGPDSRTAFARRSFLRTTQLPGISPMRRARLE